MKLHQFFADPKAITTYLKTVKTENRKQETDNTGTRKKKVTTVAVQYKEPYEFLSQSKVNTKTLPIGVLAILRIR
jgi:hypothetical protein